jgi:hypothetical protein
VKLQILLTAAQIKKKKLSEKVRKREALEETKAV